MANLMLPGNPRYQPKQLQAVFGYDHLIQGVYDVELAGLKVLGEIGLIPAEDIALLTPDTEAKVREITTTQVDRYEREVTKHDVRAAVHEMQEVLPPVLRRWVHIPFTSYDVLDTGRSLHFVRAHKEAIAPSLEKVIKQMGKTTREFADQ